MYTPVLSALIPVNSPERPGIAIIWNGSLISSVEYSELSIYNRVAAVSEDLIFENDEGAGFDFMSKYRVEYVFTTPKQASYLWSALCLRYFNRGELEKEPLIKRIYAFHHQTIAIFDSTPTEIIDPF